MFVPVNSTTTFRCSVAEGYIISWLVQGPETASPVLITIGESTPHGQFEVAEISPRSSTFTLHDITEELNPTRVICLATVEDDIFSNRGIEVLVIIYGKCTAHAGNTNNSGRSMVGCTRLWQIQDFQKGFPFILATPTLNNC